MIIGEKADSNQNGSQFKYSQYFLKDPCLVRKIIDKSSIKPNDLVYEIGPGEGIITNLLVERGVKVVAVEIDKSLCKNLFEKFREENKVKIICNDFLKCDLPLEEKYKVFSNIPFHLTSEIITKLTSAKNPPEDSYLILQKEVAKKIGSSYEKEKQHFLLSLLLEPWFKSEIIYRFKRTDFYPPSHVDVVLIQIKKRKKSSVKTENKQLYKDFINYGFSQWKPSLKNTFKKIFTYKQFKKLSKDSNFDLSAKPADLNSKQWLGLFNYFVIGVEEKKKKIVQKV